MVGLTAAPTVSCEPYGGPPAEIVHEVAGTPAALSDADHDSVADLHRRQRAPCADDVDGAAPGILTTICEPLGIGPDERPANCTRKVRESASLQSGPSVLRLRTPSRG
jgi:hypothetical protein